MTTNDWIDELLQNYRNYVKECLTLEPTSVYNPKMNTDQAKQAILQKLQEEYKRGYNDAKAGYGTLEEYGTPGEFKLVDPREFTKQEEQLTDKEQL